jgi:hypothetical protein
VQKHIDDISVLVKLAWRPIRVAGCLLRVAKKKPRAIATFITITKRVPGDWIDQSLARGRIQRLH